MRNAATYLIVRPGKRGVLNCHRCGQWSNFFLRIESRIVCCKWCGHDDERALMEYMARKSGEVLFGRDERDEDRQEYGVV